MNILNLVHYSFGFPDMISERVPRPQRPLAYVYVFLVKFACH